MPATRRRLLQAATALLPLRAVRAARREFWNKEPSAWSAEEKERLLLRSPWAQDGVLRLEKEKHLRQQAATPTVDRPGAGVPGARPNMPGSGINTSTPTVPIGEPIPPPPPGSGKGEAPSFPVRVRWDSAAPVRLAGGPELPAEAAGFYVIRVQGMPLMRPRGANQPGTAVEANQNLLQAIKHSSRIERRNKPSIPCTHLLTGSGDTATEVLLFFNRTADPIVAAEKEVDFVCRLGSFQVEVKFRLGEMMYRGKLEL